MAERSTFKQDQLRAMRERNALEAEAANKAARAAEKKAAVPALRDKVAAVPVKKVPKAKRV